MENSSYDEYAMMGGLEAFCARYGLKSKVIDRIGLLAREALKLNFENHPESEGIRLRVTYSEADGIAKVKLRTSPSQQNFLCLEQEEKKDRESGRLALIRANCDTIKERLEDGYLKLTLAFKA